MPSMRERQQAETPRHVGKPVFSAKQQQDVTRLQLKRADLAPKTPAFTGNPDKRYPVPVQQADGNG
jgi:hypothetical protein